MIEDLRMKPWRSVVQHLSNLAKLAGGSHEITTQGLVLIPPQADNDRITLTPLGCPVVCVKLTTGWTIKSDIPFLGISKNPKHYLICAVIESIMKGHAQEHALIKNNRWIGTAHYIPFPGGAYGNTNQAFKDTEKEEFAITRVLPPWRP